jgi:predicted ATPase
MRFRVQVQKTRKYIITGGPHSGKSGVISLLDDRGIQVLHETARIIIMEDQEKRNTDPSFKQLYPWEDQKIFCRRCHERQKEREKGLTGEFAVLDRSIIDNLAYAVVAGIELDKRIYADIADAHYEKKVFFFELLGEYEMDEQRRDTPDQVMAVHREIYNAYSSIGFEMITIPVFSHDMETNIQTRAAMVLEHIMRELSYGSGAI